jgi:EmrB/QacA subfamily drug resistance transporter
MRSFSPASDTISPRSRFPALMVLCAGMLMIILDATIVNVALPAIQTDLGFSQPNLAWVVNAYLIAFGGLLLLAGRLGDLLGRKRLFLNGLVVFTTASLFCGLANSQNVLIIARFIQGAGGALASAGILGMIVTMFREPAEQAKAIGVYSFVAAAGGSIGLIAGGILTQALNWHWIFFVNLPIGIATGICASRLLPRERGSGLGDGADVVGAALITAALMLGVFTIVQSADHGWSSARTMTLAAVSLVLLALFIVRQLSARNPLMPLVIFRSRITSGANLVQILTMAGLFGQFFLLALYMQRVLGYSEIEIGLAYLGLTAGIAVMSLGAAPSLITRFGAPTVLVPGLLLILIGLGLSARMPVRGSYWLDIFPSMLTVGIGAGFTFPAVMTLAMAGVQPHQSGLASGLANTTQQVGGALGLAMLATLASSRSNHLAQHGESVGRSLTGGYHLAFTVGSALIVVAALVAATLMGPERAVVAAEEIFVPVTASEECPRRVSIAPRRWARWRDRGAAMSRRCAESVAPVPLPDAGPDIA